MRWLRAGFPPLDVRLDLVELGEGAVLAGLGGEHLVELFVLHAVGEQGEFQGGLGQLAQAALAGEFLDVPEIAPAGGSAGELVAVVGEHRGVDEEANAAGLDGAGNEVLILQADLRRVDLFEHALVAAAGEFGALHFDHVPGDAAGAHHGLDLGHFTVVFAGHQAVAAALLPGVVERLDLGVLVGAAEGNDGEIGRECGADDCQCGRQGSELEDLDHYCCLHVAGVASMNSGCRQGRRSMHTVVGQLVVEGTARARFYARFSVDQVVKRKKAWSVSTMPFSVSLSRCWGRRTARLRALRVAASAG
ncbi:hypothetical protein D3C78_930460 [compost metagenome]